MEFQALLLTIHPQKLKSITSLLTSVKLTGLIPNKIRDLLKLEVFFVSPAILFPVIVNHVTKGLAVKNLYGRLLASNGNLKHVQKIANQSLRLTGNIEKSFKDVVREHS